MIITVRTLSALAIATTVLTANLIGSSNAIAGDLKGTPPRHACHGNACGQGNTIPDCRGAHRGPNGEEIQCK